MTCSYSHLSVRYEVGDVLIQAMGSPWPELAYLCTGEPFPHAQMVSAVDAHGRCTRIVEAHADGVWEKDPWNIEWFEVWRARCGPDIRQAAVLWMLAHQGDAYAYGKLLQIAAGTRLGLWQEPEDFDAEHFDCEPMVCSEKITRALWRNGHDPAPGISNRNTLPGILRNPRTMKPIHTLRPIRMPV